MSLRSSCDVYIEYLNVWDGFSAVELEEEIARRAKGIHNVQENGEIIYRFRSFSFLAEKLE